MATYFAPNSIASTLNSLKQQQDAWAKREELEQQRARSLFNAGVAVDDKKAIAQGLNAMDHGAGLSSLFAQDKYQPKTFGTDLKEKEMKSREENTMKTSDEYKSELMRGSDRKRKLLSDVYKTGGDNFKALKENPIDFLSGNEDFKSLSDEEKSEVFSHLANLDEKHLAQATDLAYRKDEKDRNRVKAILQKESGLSGQDYSEKDLGSYYDGMMQAEQGRQELDGITRETFTALAGQRDAIDQSGPDYAKARKEAEADIKKSSALDRMERKKASSEENKFQKDVRSKVTKHSKKYKLLQTQIDRANIKIDRTNKGSEAHNEKVSEIKTLLAGDADEQERGFLKQFEYGMDKAKNYTQAAKAAREYIVGMSTHDHAYGNNSMRGKSVEDLIGKPPKYRARKVEKYVAKYIDGKTGQPVDFVVDMRPGEDLQAACKRINTPAARRALAGSGHRLIKTTTEQGLAAAEKTELANEITGDFYTKQKLEDLKTLVSDIDPWYGKTNTAKKLEISTAIAKFERLNHVEVIKDSNGKPIGARKKVPAGPALFKQGPIGMVDGIKKKWGKKE